MLESYHIGFDMAICSREGTCDMVTRPYEEKSYDLIVVGGGLSGLCSALAAARHGVKTALVQDRPVLGGNASSEIRMHICGASRHRGRLNARETGIVEEIQIDTHAVNPNYSFSTLDTIMWEKARFQENLKLYLNTRMTDVEMDGPRVKAILCDQITTERRFRMTAPRFVDATGDAMLAYLAGAEYRMGREGKGQHGEHWAPDTEDHHTMGNSLLFRAVDVGYPVPFKKPEWAYTITEEMLKHRGHQEVSSGYWWIELGGDDTNIITDGEEIRDELLKTLYGIWDHIKNGGDHGAENYALDWVGHLPGKRESRRVIGDHVLDENDIMAARVFEDAIAYGGWSMDVHVVGGFRTREEPTQFLGDFDLYTIPYRATYSKNIENLFVGGRAFSTTHMAFSSIRVMATCGVVGQAIGTAAAIAHRENIMPREVGGHIKELQATLMRDDCYIPGYLNFHPDDIAPMAKVVASSETPGGEAALILNGQMRRVGEEGNSWVSAPSGKPEWIELSWEKPVGAGEIILRFDSDLSSEIMVSLSENARKRHIVGNAKELVKDYTLTLLNAGKPVHTEKVEGNHRRLCRHMIGDIAFDSVLVDIHTTHGDPSARLIQINVYKRG